MKLSINRLNIVPIILFATCMWLSQAQACTRVLYEGANQTVITGRSMDWSEDMKTNLWIFPRGMKREGQAGVGSPTWTSKYGSIVASVYGIASADGMNEKGLVMNILYLAESNYGKARQGHPPLSVSLWGQYTLDNFSTVAEAVESMQDNPFQILAPRLPNGKPSQVHLSLSDATGDSAILEYINGKLVIHHNKKYNVMTNSPIYSKQLALNEYWESIGGTVFLPGTARAADRFARTAYYINTIPKTLDEHYIRGVPNHSFGNQAVASVLSIIRAVSVPLGITMKDKPNIASTIWRTVADQKNLIYYFDSSTRPNTFWINLKKIDLKPGAPVLKLPLDEGQVYANDVYKYFIPSAPFEFLSAKIDE